MNNLRTQPIIRALANLKITVVCIFLLFVLTFWGTVAQVEQGLYVAQERFFHAWFFMASGFIPFPGAQLVLWILFINLVCASITRFVWRWSKIGIWITHVGLLLFFVGAFVTLHGVKESNVTLAEGESANVSVAYHDWELAFWKQNGNARQVFARDIGPSDAGSTMRFDPAGLVVGVETYYANSQAYSSAQPEKDLINDSGIHAVKAEPLNKEIEKNQPGTILQIHGQDGGRWRVVLFGGESSPTKIRIGNEDLFVMLRRKHYPLPLTLKLLEFKKDLHPNTEMARSYQSKVELTAGAVHRDVVISMNKPLRHNEFTFYQASYAVDAMGREHSTLAVVRNPARLLPYISSFLTFAGLAIHFLMMAFTRKKLK